MKSITLIRHAEASYSTQVLTDFDRPLTIQGVDDAKLMGCTLSDKKIKINLVISSSANRALTTAQIICDKIGYKNSIQEKQTMYHASADEIINLISNCNNQINSIALFGHNPTFHILIEKLTNQHFEKFPPCAIAKVNLNIHNWNQIDSYLSQTNINASDLEYFIYPKKLAL